MTAKFQNHSAVQRLRKAADEIVRSLDLSENMDAPDYSDVFNGIEGIFSAVAAIAMAANHGRFGSKMLSEGYFCALHLKDETLASELLHKWYFDAKTHNRLFPDKTIRYHVSLFWPFTSKKSESLLVEITEDALSREQFLKLWQDNKREE